jgi:hypothetical protein
LIRESNIVDRHSLFVTPLAEFRGCGRNCNDSFDASEGNTYFTWRTPRTPPRATESHFSFVLLLNTTAAEVVRLIVRTLELDQAAMLGITPLTMHMGFTVRQFVHNFPPFLR